MVGKREDGGFIACVGLGVGVWVSSSSLSPSSSDCDGLISGKLVEWQHAGKATASRG